ncbi:MAG: hypothetical protein KFB93_01500 [Simkaniaceae bacterium]|nr:MAG: hypothetical protein KFB93_01500 [Simkaniaceae bacterium]
METLALPSHRRDSQEHLIQVSDPTRYTSRLVIFVDRTLIQGITAVETTTHLVARRALQGTSVVASFVGRIPFIPLSLKFAGDNTVYGVFLAYGATTSFGYLVAYSFLKIIDSQMKPLTPEEHYLLHSRVGPAAKKILLICGTLLGIGTQIPFAIIAYKYNKPSTLNPGGYLMPAMVVLIDSWVSTYSAYMGLRSIGERSCRAPYEKELDVIRGKMLGFIGENQELFTLADRQTQLGFVDAYQRIRTVHESEDRVRQFYALYTGRITDQTLTRSNWAIGADYVVKAYGYICAGCNIGTMAYVAYLGADVPGLNIAVTALYVGTALYLNTTAIPQTAAKLFNLVKDIFTCGYKPTLADQLSPKLSFTLKALNLATAGLSYGTAMQISKDYYSEHEWLEITMEVTLTCATTFLVSMAMLSITDDLLETKIEKYGTEEEKQIIEVHQKMRHFSTALASSPFIDLALYMKAIPPEALEMLRINTQISLENLDQYIQTHLPHHTSATPLLTYE